MDAPLILRLLSTSVKVSYAAGSIIKEVLSSGDLGIVDKGINDLQTLADRKAQACIVNSLQTKFPGICVIGEENLSKENLNNEEKIDLSDDEFILNQNCPDDLKNINIKDIVVWVDPLDGTSEYTQGLVEHVTVLIGLAVSGKAVGGVIHQPFVSYNRSGRSIYALKGMGVFNNDRHFKEAENPPSDNCNIITTTRGHSTPLVQKALDACKPTEILRVGGCGHKVMLLLENRCHAYVFASPGCKKWDTCAPEAILTEAGGSLVDICGNKLDYSANVAHPNKLGVLATAQSSWLSQYLSSIPNEIKEKLKGDAK